MIWKLLPPLIKSNRGGRNGKLADDTNQVCFFNRFADVGGTSRLITSLYVFFSRGSGERSYRGGRASLLLFPFSNFPNRRIASITGICTSINTRS